MRKRNPIGVFFLAIKTLHTFKEMEKTMGLSKLYFNFLFVKTNAKPSPISPSSFLHSKI